MPVLGLTGGIATGKSTFARLLLREMPMEFYDADRSVHALLAESHSVRDAIVATFGREVLDPQGRPDRARLRERVFQHEGERQALEAILHPAVQEQRRQKAADARSKKTWLLADVPLLYETGVQGEFDCVIVVASARATQLRRMIHERSLAPEHAERILAAQLDLGTKTQLADYVIWNDSTVHNLDGQSRLLAASLRQRFAGS